MSHPASNQPHRYELPPEPFGQRGVRQYVGRASTVLCLVVMFGAIAMLARSHFTTDVIARVDDDGLIEIRSIYGRLLVYSRPFVRTETDPHGWLMQSYPMPTRIRDPWVPSWKKTLGFEIGFSDLAGRAEPGWWWMRLKWSTLAIVAGLLPIGKAIQNRIGQWRRRRGMIAKSSVPGQPATPLTGAPGRPGLARN